MQAKRTSWTWVVVTVVITVVAGSFLGVARANATDASPCEYNMCFLTQGNCDLTTHNYDCEETAGGCKDSVCFRD